MTHCRAPKIYPTQSITAKITGDISAIPAGLKSGKETQMTVDDTKWWPLPASPYANRQGIAIQNENTDALDKVRINFDNAAPFVGTIIYALGERFYQIDETTIIYAKAFPGRTVTLNIEELADV